MKKRPILFNTEMAKAVHEGRKTQTRRPIKCIHEIIDTASPEEWNTGKAHPNMIDFEKWGPAQGIHLFRDNYGSVFGMPCPFGQPGDRLWVRETWKPAWTYKHGHGLLFKADNAFLCFNGCCNNLKVREGYEWIVDHYDSNEKWRSPRFMPRWASRTSLENIRVWPERVQDITPEDVLKEGIHLDWDKHEGHDYELVYAFADYWNSCYAKQPEYQWEANPWVWADDFVKVNNISITKGQNEK